MNVLTKPVSVRQLRWEINFIITVVRGEQQHTSDEGISELLFTANIKERRTEGLPFSESEGIPFRYGDDFRWLK
jgi:hypothetical protein